MQICSDYLLFLKTLPNNSIDMVLTDPPYAMTMNKWDVEFDLKDFWQEINRVKKINAPVVIFTAGLFTAKMIMSNEKSYKYDLIWQKGNRVSGFLNAKKQPLRNHENILIFYDKPPTYNPQFITGKPLHGRGTSYLHKERVCNNYNKHKHTEDTRAGSTQKYPKSVLNFEKPFPAKHPTQKPVKLFEYLIKTYSNENNTILDCFAGIGTCKEACENTNRKFLGCDSNQKYCDIANQIIDKQDTLLDY